MNPKVLRGQLRQIVKDIFPELVSTELYVKLQEENKRQLDLIHKLVRESLERMDDRQKDVQNMVMRELMASAPKPLTANDDTSKVVSNE